MQPEAFEKLEREARPLWARYWLSGGGVHPRDEALRWALVSHYLPLVERAARLWVKSKPKTRHAIANGEDLAQDLSMVLHELVEAYNPARHPGVPFNRYAASRLQLRSASCMRMYRFGPRRPIEGAPPIRCHSLHDATGGNDNGYTHADALEDTAAPASSRQQLRDDAAYRRDILKALPRKMQAFAIRRWWRLAPLSDLATRFGVSSATCSTWQMRCAQTIAGALGKHELFTLSGTGRNVGLKHHGKGPKPGSHPPRRTRRNLADVDRRAA